MAYLDCQIDKRSYDRYSAKYLSYCSYGFPVDDDTSVTPNSYIPGKDFAEKANLKFSRALP
jgi:hypothetical protein